MRLIDADALIESVNQIRYFRKIQAKRVIDSMPTVDAVPVIRCKDCVFCEGNVCRLYLVERHEVDDDDFCSEAVREEHD